MLLKKIFPLFIVILISFTACHNGEMQEEAMSAYVATADSFGTSSASDISNLNSDTRKVIRKADIRCRVDNVQQAVKELETFTTMVEGFVQESSMQNNIVNERTAEYKDDSLKKVQMYSTTAHLTIRIPVYALDTLAYRIHDIASFIDHRNMVREDVTLQFLSNVLKNRTNAHDKKADTTPVTSAAIAATAQYKDDKKVQQVDRRIANLAMLDNVNYATLSLELYQPDQVSVVIVQNADKLVAPAYGEKLQSAFGKSIEIVKGFILVVITIWPVWLVLIAIAVWYKRTTRKQKPVLVKP